MVSPVQDSPHALESTLLGRSLVHVFIQGLNHKSGLLPPLLHQAMFGIKFLPMSSHHRLDGLGRFGGSRSKFLIGGCLVATFEDIGHEMIQFRGRESNRAVRVPFLEGFKLLGIIQQLGQQ